MKRPLEIAVDHLKSIDSAWNLDLTILRNGMADACMRIEALENVNAKAAQTPAPAKPQP